MGEKVIAVPGSGNVSFPDTMSNDDIARVIRLHTPEPDTKGSPEWATWRNQRVHDLNDAATTPNQPEDKGFFHGLWQAVNPYPILQALNPAQKGGPLQGVENLAVNAGNSQVDQGKKAAAAFKQGDYVSAAGHGLAAVVPLVGPAAANAGDAIGDGRTGEGLGQAAGLVGSVVAPAALGAAERLAPGVRPAAADALRANAETQYGRVLNPTTKANKLRTADVVPQLIDRGVTAVTLKGLQGQVQGQIARVGQAIGDEWQNLPAGTTTPLKPIYDRLQGEMDTTHSIPDSSGKLIPKGPVAATAIKNLTGLQQVLTDVAEKDPQTGELVIPVDKVRDLRQYFDGVQKDAGAFEGKSLNEQSVARAHQIAADSIRGELGKQFPDIDALNKEYSFWKDVSQVTGDTLARRQGQATPLSVKAAQAAGFVKGGPLGAEAMKALATATQSPAWGTVTAVLKDRLADAVAGGQTGPIVFYAQKALQGAGTETSLIDTKPDARADLPPALVAQADALRAQTH